MQDWEELEELDGLGEGAGGEEGEGAWPEGLPRPPGGGSLSTAPLLQALACVLLFLGLVYLRETGHPAYGEIAARYRQEAAQEIRLEDIPLPRWEGGPAPSPAPSPSPAGTPGPSPAPVGVPGVQVQRL